MSSLKSSQDKTRKFLINIYVSISFKNKKPTKNTSSKNIENPFTKKLENIKKTYNKKIFQKNKSSQKSKNQILYKHVLNLICYYSESRLLFHQINCLIRKPKDKKIIHNLKSPLDIFY